MRDAMMNAEVGDDVLGDDPTVIALEKKVAEILGKEAAVYVSSGTMSNQIAVRAHTEPGDEIILEANAHIYIYEAGAPAAISGVMCRLLPGKRGVFTADDLKAVLRMNDVHFAPSKLVCIENTHNRGGGSIWPIEQIARIAGVAGENNLRMHMDGARIWNASVATGIAEAEYAKYFDSVSVCFSKGLGAPVGSALAGTQEYIKRTRRFRKQFGGGMRQAGIIAAGALYGLDNHRERLAEDHENARLLAEGIDSISGLKIDMSTVETNLVFFKVGDGKAVDFMMEAHQKGVYLLPTAADTIRAVTSLAVNRDDIHNAVDIIRSIS